MTNEKTLSGFPARGKYSSGQTPVIRLQIEESISQKIAALRFDAQQRGESLYSLSSIVEDAVELLYAETFKGRTPPAFEDYKAFTKTKAK